MMKRPCGGDGGRLRTPLQHRLTRALAPAALALAGCAASPTVEPTAMPPSTSASPAPTGGATSSPDPPHGRLPPEVIQKVVRANFGALRACYEDGLFNNPKLEGRVGINFVIGLDGSVTQVQLGGSDLPDPAVVRCILQNFGELRFPPPVGGIVTVGYPIMFSPGGGPGPAPKSP